MYFVCMHSFHRFRPSAPLTLTMITRLGQVDLEQCSKGSGRRPLLPLKKYLLLIGKRYCSYVQGFCYLLQIQVCTSIFSPQADILGALYHPNIVQLFGVVNEGSDHALVMGECLTQYTTSKHLFKQPPCSLQSQEKMVHSMTSFVTHNNQAYY